MQPRTSSTAASTAPPSARASRLARVQRGVVAVAMRILFYADGGVGKTTWAASFPRPIFIDCNQGSLRLDVTRYLFDQERLKPETFDEFLAALEDIEQNAREDYETVVIDALSDVEILIFAAVLKRDGKAKTIEDVGGGYGKGYVAALDEWRRMTAILERIWQSGRHVILIDHVANKKSKNATGLDFGRFAPKIDVQAGAFLHTWSDETFFAHVATTLVPDNADAKKAKKVYAMSEGERVIHTVAAAEWLAKNREGLPETIEMPVTGGWEILSAEIAGAAERRRAELISSIEEMLAGVTQEVADKTRDFLKRAGDDPAKLAQLANWVAARRGKAA